VSASPGAPWDFPTRAFHWSLAALVVFSYTTGKVGGPWLDWHMRSGYAILALLVFRVGWGFVGGGNSRFASFIRGPRAALDHGRALISRSVRNAAGHTPLGGWMVLAMIAFFALQAVTGLFTNDESSHEGPLAAMVSNATVDRMSVIHEWNQWVLVGLVAVHVLAIAFYHAVLRMNLTRTMVGGPVAFPARAWIVLALAAAAVYVVVMVVPGQK